MAERTIPQPQFPQDTGEADPEVSEALTAYAEGRGGEHRVLAVLADSRLLVPVVAMLTEEAPVAEGELRREKESEMALPTLIGADGRRGVLGFTSVESLIRWRADARPVAVDARQACLAALNEGADALVIDVAGPVPFAIDGYRLRTLAEGKQVPPTHQDPDVLAVVEAALGTERGVSEVRVGPGRSAELLVRFTLASDLDERATVARVADRLAEQLRGRIVGGAELVVTRDQP